MTMLDPLASRPRAATALMAWCAFVAGCGDGTPGDGPPVVNDLCPDENAELLELFDVDGDTIRNEDEGLDDADGDGIPNFQDLDSDGDTIPDLEEAGDGFCSTAPVDLDGDGLPNFLDVDANGDGIFDGDQLEPLPGGEEPAHLERDLDGDGLSNWIELGPDGESIDSDFDGLPDLLDTDSDGDLILDREERDLDVDGDGISNFRDLDSDGDGLSDARESGDGILETSPVTCEEELDREWDQDRDGLPPVLESDGFPDFLDADSDNDGLSDGEEEALGTDICGWDTDDDGLSDLVEAAFERVNCAEGPDAEGARGCGCALDPDCTIPESDFFVVLPFGSEPVVRELEFGTTIRQMDLFFLTDTTCSMSGTIANVKTTVLDLIDEVNAQIPDAWFGGGQFDDFPFSPYGSGPDTAFDLSIGMQPPELKDEVRSAFEGIQRHNGNDLPESHSEALYQLFTGEGGVFTNGGSTYTIPAFADDCLEGGFGAACFRSLALQVVVMFTDICSHEAPPGENCNAYTGITPRPASWNQAIFEMNKVGAKFIGVNVTSQECDDNPSPSTTGSGGPCYYLTNTAEVTSSVDFAREALVYDLPNNSSNDAFVSTMTEAVDRVATRVPFDVDTTVRDDPTDPELVDARDFIKERRPACEYNRILDEGELPEDPCWTPPEDVAPENAVAFIDSSTFFDILPGTRVTFDIAFQNTTFRPADTAKVFVAFIDVRGDGSAVLDTRQVIIVIPGGNECGDEFDC